VIAKHQLLAIAVFRDISCVNRAGEVARSAMRDWQRPPHVSKRILEMTGRMLVA
jgi:hypothetical protein